MQLLFSQTHKDNKIVTYFFTLRHKWRQFSVKWFSCKCQPGSAHHCRKWIQPLLHNLGEFWSELCFIFWTAVCRCPSWIESNSAFQSTKCLKFPSSLSSCQLPQNSTFCWLHRQLCQRLTHSSFSFTGHQTGCSLPVQELFDAWLQDFTSFADSSPPVNEAFSDKAQVGN